MRKQYKIETSSSDEFYKITNLLFSKGFVYTSQRLKKTLYERDSRWL